LIIKDTIGILGYSLKYQFIISRLKKEKQFG
jgi:hypothetical protein